jgi:hypothetical protein
LGAKSCVRTSKKTTEFVEKNDDVRRLLEMPTPQPPLPAAKKPREDEDSRLLALLLEDDSWDDDDDDDGGGSLDSSLSSAFDV